MVANSYEKYLVLTLERSETTLFLSPLVLELCLDTDLPRLCDDAVLLAQRPISIYMPSGAAAVEVTATWIFIPLGEQLYREIIEADLQKLRSSTVFTNFQYRSSFNAVACHSCRLLAEWKPPRKPAETPRSAVSSIL
nr:hypothetical protein Iba_chr12bCG21610 [Ipomoea batatas]